MDILKVVSRVSGKCVSRIAVLKADRLTIHFTDGSALQVQHGGSGFRLDLVSADGSDKCPVAIQPTTRQREYLQFIEKYMARYRGSPAESDIQRHFLVSAPSVNSMMQMLERRGFISRQPGVPRSIRLTEPGKCDLCGGTHYVEGP